MHCTHATTAVILFTSMTKYETMKDKTQACLWQQHYARQRLLRPKMRHFWRSGVKNWAQRINCDVWQYGMCKDTMSSHKNIVLPHIEPQITMKPLQKKTKKSPKNTAKHFPTSYFSHTDSMAVGEYQWAKIQVEKHLLVWIPQKPAKQIKNKIINSSPGLSGCTYFTMHRYS